MLTDTDAKLMALQQSVQAARLRIITCIDRLEDVQGDMTPINSRAGHLEDLHEVILSLQHTVDFILRSHMP